MNQHIPKVAVFPGTFDPLTRGHLDVIARSCHLFDQLIVAIGLNPEKAELFPVAERIEMIAGLIKQYPNVTVESYDGLTVEFARQRGAVAILRGLRNLSDLQYEFQIALTNRAVAGMETVFIMTSEHYGFTSSSLIKQIVGFGGDPQGLAQLLPPIVVDRLKYYHDHKLGIFARDPRDHMKG